MKLKIDLSHETKTDIWENTNALQVAHDDGASDPLQIMLQEEEKDAIENAWYDRYLES